MSTCPVRLIVGGASKSGTTALYYYLRQHPSLCLPERKELHYFSRDCLKERIAGPGDSEVIADIPETFDAYASLFRGRNDGLVGADVSPSYLYYSQTAHSIASVISDPFVLFVLRNPADKAFSQYVHLLSSGRETLSFEEALDREDERFQAGFSDMWLYRRSGFYAEALSRFIEALGGQRTCIAYYDEFVADPKSLLAMVCRVLGIDESFSFKPVADVNRTGVPRSRLMASLLRPGAARSRLRRLFPARVGREALRFLKSLNVGQKPQFADDIRRQLLAEYRADILRVEALVGRRSGWLSD